MEKNNYLIRKIDSVKFLLSIDNKLQSQKYDKLELVKDFGPCFGGSCGGAKKPDYDVLVFTGQKGDSVPIISLYDKGNKFLFELEDCSFLEGLEGFFKRAEYCAWFHLFN